jgi:hypothetical protein
MSLLCRLSLQIGAFGGVAALADARAVGAAYGAVSMASTDVVKDYQRYIREFDKVDTCNLSPELELRLEQLFRTIQAWNHELTGLTDESCVFAGGSS